MGWPKFQKIVLNDALIKPMETVFCLQFLNFRFLFLYPKFCFHKNAHLTHKSTSTEPHPYRCSNIFEIGFPFILRNILMGVFHRILQIKSLYKSNRMSVCSEGTLQFKFKPVETCLSQTTEMIKFFNFIEASHV